MAKTKGAAKSLDLAHRLLELADRYHVHVPQQLRNDVFKLQDAVIVAINKTIEKDLQ